jgi:predicted ester cyclase
VLERLADRDLARRLERRPGQKEVRWMQLLGAVADRPADAKEVARRFYEEVINERRPELVADLVSPGFVHNGEARGIEGQTEAVQAYLDAFDPLTAEIELILAEGDLVGSRQRWTGTHSGPFMGIAPSGRRVEFTSNALLRVRDGRIAEAWDEVDLLGLRRQLG